MIFLVSRGFFVAKQVILFQNRFFMLRGEVREMYNKGRSVRQSVSPSVRQSVLGETR